MDLRDKFVETEMPEDRVETTFCFERKFKANVTETSVWEDGSPPTEADVTVYTDGSKTEEGTGAGVYSEEMNLKLSIPLGTHTTVFQSEVFAIDESARQMVRAELSGKKVLICSDSKSSIDALSSCKFSSALVLQCFRALETLSEKNEVDLTWVPAHSGVLGNELADELAREASGSKFVGPEPAGGRHAGSIKVQVKMETANCHQRRWEVLDSCRQAKEFLKGCDSKTTEFLLSLSRAKLRILAGVLIGHTCLNYHLNKIGIVNDPTCRGCGFEPETARHFICSCPALKDLRTRSLGDFYITPEEQLELHPAKLKCFPLFQEANG